MTSCTGASIACAFAPPCPTRRACVITGGESAQSTGRCAGGYRFRNRRRWPRLDRRADRRVVSVRCRAPPHTAPAQHVNIRQSVPRVCAFVSPYPRVCLTAARVYRYTCVRACVRSKNAIYFTVSPRARRKRLRFSDNWLSRGNTFAVCPLVDQVNSHPPANSHSHARSLHINGGSRTGWLARFQLAVGESRGG